ncbi:OLC1v1031346C1 [Oldenlandia corymbosa var. corymbosa]|uniref:AT-hook motif nuclear-localized protein n=1 Tax=Oldenlandia corymbosa var. corymbosa TaxID=529605 RepID=A0AAV1CK73_OLDCO|nr:OLC1v1031346C1 [Oldenlandia corymbosa var. corymbosa]
MDSQDSTAAPPPHHLHHQQTYHPHHQQQQQQHHHHHAQPPPPSTILVSPSHQHRPQPNSYPLQNPNNNNMMQNQQNPSAPRFPFNTMMSPSGPKPIIDYSDGGGGGGPASPNGGAGSAGGFSIEPAKKKRGRPRKYSPDRSGSSIALGLSPTPVTPMSSGMGLADSGAGGTATHSTEAPAKKHRGRPPGSGKKQLDALGVSGVGFTPHVITVKAGEDIAGKITAFSQQGPRTICILSANGALCSVTLRQPGSNNGTVTYEGRFEIISLSGSYSLAEDTARRGPNLSVSLAGSDGRVMGGGVAGALMAATPVQVVVGSFIADGKKPKSSKSSAAQAPNMLNFGNPTSGASPPSPSQGASSDSSDDHGSPLNRSTGPYNNAQPMHNIPTMYTNMGWPNSSMKMHPN